MPWSSPPGSLYRLLGRLREVILWILIAAFIALVLNPAGELPPAPRPAPGELRSGSSSSPPWCCSSASSACSAIPLVNSLTHVAGRLPTMVDQVQKGHGWLAHTLRRFHLLSWVQKNAPKLKTAANNLARPALNAGEAVASTLAGRHHHRLPHPVHAAGGAQAPR